MARKPILKPTRTKARFLPVEAYGIKLATLHRKTLRKARAGSYGRLPQASKP